MVRKSKGRQKIEMVKMKNETNLQVTFSKRRAGLFKKASELCTLCGAEIAVIAFSPGGKVFSFGHPNVNLVIDRFSNINPPHPNQNNNMQLNEARRNVVVRDLNNHLTQVTEQLEADQKRTEDLKQKRKDDKMPENRWNKPIKEFNLSQLTELKFGLENLRKTVTTEASKYLQANGPNFYFGSSSNAAFGISNDADLDLFNHERMVVMNMFASNHNNMIVCNPTTTLSENNVVERLAQEHNQSQNQYCFKQERISQCDHHPGHPPHGGLGYY